MNRIFLLLTTLMIFVLIFIYVFWVRSFSLIELKDEDSPSGLYKVKTVLGNPRTEAGGTAIGNKVYLLGGIDSFAKTLTDFYQYDIDEDEWTRLPDIPYPVNHPGVVTDGVNVFVIGGFGPLGLRIRGFMFANWNPLNKVYKFNVKSCNWIRLENLPEARGAGGVAFGEGKIFYSGGIGEDKGLSNKLFEFDIGNNTWRSLSTMKTARDHFRMEYVNGALYAISGRLDDLRFNLKSVEKYNLKQDLWTNVSDIPAGRGGLGSVVYKGNIITFGGENVWECFNGMEKYDPEKDQWVKLSNLPEARHGIVGGVVNNNIYLISGGRNSRISVSGINRVFVPNF